MDPSGHSVTDWDKKHLSKKELKHLEGLTDVWNKASEKGDKKTADLAHQVAEHFRNKYRDKDEISTGDGHTKSTSRMSDREIQREIDKNKGRYMDEEKYGGKGTTDMTYNQKEAHLNANKLRDTLANRARGTDLEDLANSLVDSRGNDAGTWEKYKRVRKEQELANKIINGGTITRDDYESYAGLMISEIIAAKTGRNEDIDIKLNAELVAESLNNASLNPYEQRYLKQMHMISSNDGGSSIIKDAGTLDKAVMDSLRTGTLDKAIIDIIRSRMNAQLSGLEATNEDDTVGEGTGNLVTVSQLQDLGWTGADQAMADEINDAMEMFGVNEGEYATEQIIAFMATAGHESGLGYSNFIQVGASGPNRGAGAMQLTGYDNYKSFYKYMKAKGIDDPEIIGDNGYKVVAEKYAWVSAAWYWDKHTGNKLDCQQFSRQLF